MLKGSSGEPTRNSRCSVVTGVGGWTLMMAEVRTPYVPVLDVSHLLLDRNASWVPLN